LELAPKDAQRHGIQLTTYRGKLTNSLQGVTEQEPTDSGHGQRSNRANTDSGQTTTPTSSIARDFRGVSSSSARTNNNGKDDDHDEKRQGNSHNKRRVDGYTIGKKKAFNKDKNEDDQEQVDQGTKVDQGTMAIVTSGSSRKRTGEVMTTAIPGKGKMKDHTSRCKDHSN
jgi:hypothetical protein